MENNYDEVYFVNNSEDRLQVKNILKKLGYKWMEGQEIFDYQEPKNTCAFCVINKKVVFITILTRKEVKNIIEWNYKHLYDD